MGRKAIVQVWLSSCLPLVSSLAWAIRLFVLDKFVLIFRLDADPANWMDGGSWEGTMSDLLWDEDGEMYRCSPRPAAWHPPNKITGRQSHDSLLSLKRLVACSKQCECLTSHSHNAAISLALTCNSVLLMQHSGCRSAVLVSASWKTYLCCQAMLLQNLRLMLV